MRMWSRGLGKENLGLCFIDAEIKTFDEALDTMPPTAKERLLASVNGKKSRSLAVSGKISPPVGWEYVILIERSDVFYLLRKLLTLKTLKLFF